MSRRETEDILFKALECWPRLLITEHGRGNPESLGTLVAIAASGFLAKDDFGGFAELRGEVEAQFARHGNRHWHVRYYFGSISGLEP